MTSPFARRQARCAAMSCKRCVQSFSRQRRSRRCNGAGVAGGRWTSQGRVATIAASVSANVFLPDARIPVNISYSTHPNDQISVRLSTVKPRACSGLIYAAVPNSVPDCVLSDLVAFVPPIHATVSRAFATPKSSTLTVPSGRTLIFEGFRSRWMIPAACAAWSASVICLAIKSTSGWEAPTANPFEQRVAIDELENEDLAAMLRPAEDQVHGGNIRMTDAR